MKIFYYCYGGAHSSVVAAALHLKIISPPLTKEKILKLPYFDLTIPENRGIPIKLGEDKKGNKIYFVGLGKNKKLIVKFAENFLAAHKIRDDNYILIDCLVNISFYVKLGGFISKVLNFKTLGTSITATGIINSEEELIKAVDAAKQISSGNTNILTKI
ncbi:DUF3189 family protein [Proteinivorax tanatarense]|uniref:DUF3189 family protein n=1 Tax=Proteinivorax tanatarense TaxID=1260629 RepID=A0AAU7VHY5_9FIRM